MSFPNVLPGLPFMSPFDFASLLLLLGFLIGVVNDRTLKLPRPVALLLGSLIASALIIGAGDLFGAEGLRARLHDRVLESEWPQALLNGVLALLLFAGSLHTDLRGLARRIFAVFVLATIGVVIAAGLFGAG